jgi:hypothetical protein
MEDFGDQENFIFANVAKVLVYNSTVLGTLFISGSHRINFDNRYDVLGEFLGLGHLAKGERKSDKTVNGL